MSQPLSKLLQRRKALATKRDEIDAELRKLDHQIFPRIQTLAGAIEGTIGGAETPMTNLPASALEKIAQMANIERSALTGERNALIEAVRHRQRPKLLVVDVEKVLKEFKRPMKTGELYEELKRRGIEVTGKVPQNNLSAHLSHHSNMFVSTANGWVLRSQQFLDPENTSAHASH